MVRFKNRYFLVEVVAADGRTDEGLTGKHVLDAARDALQRLHGDWGLAVCQQSLQVKYVNVYTGLCILRVGRDHHQLVWGALTTVTLLRKRPVVLTVVHLGGTMVSVQKAAVQHSKQLLLRCLKDCTTPAEVQRVQELVLRAEREVKALEY